MKLKATKKEMRETKPLKIGYCKAQYLLYYEKPFAYSSGVYGWSCDYYKISGVIISSGYSPIGQEVGYELLRKHEQKASEIINNHKLDYKTKEAQVNALLNNFIEQAKQ